MSKRDFENFPRTEDHIDIVVKLNSSQQEIVAAGLPVIVPASMQPQCGLGGKNDESSSFGSQPDTVGVFRASDWTDSLREECDLKCHHLTDRHTRIKPHTFLSCIHSGMSLWSAMELTIGVNQLIFPFHDTTNLLYIPQINIVLLNLESVVTSYFTNDFTTNDILHMSMM